MIELINLSKKYNSITGDINILSNVNIKLPSKGLVEICGRSGCGKTTLLNILSGKDLDYTGEVLFDSININSKKINIRNSFYNSNVFYLKYNENFIDKMLVKSSLKFYLSKEENKRAFSYINKFELNSLLNKRLSRLSSGELQKISLIIAISKEANITILDEPICNLDKESINLFLKEIKELSKKKLVIYVSHLESDIESFCDMKIRFKDSKLYIEKDYKNYDNILKNNISNKINIYRIFLAEQTKPNFVYFLFRLIVLTFLFLMLYNIRLNGITKKDVVVNNINKMSINIFDTKRKVDDDYIENKEIYTKASKDSYIRTSAYPDRFDSSVSIKGYGKASDYKFYKFSSNLNDNEIIISDYLAYRLNASLSDTINIKHVLTLDEVSDGKSSESYTVKYIYETNYIDYIENDLDIPDDYQYIFFSDKVIDQIKESAFNGFSGIYLSNDTFVSSYSSSYKNSNIYRVNSTLDELEYDEFYANSISLYHLGLDELSQDVDKYLNGDSSKYYSVTFTYNNKSITKLLKYKGYIDQSNTTMINQKLYYELMNEFGITLDNCISNVFVKTINYDNVDLNVAFNDFTDFKYISFVNDSILTKSYSSIKSTQDFMNTNSIFMYLFGLIFMIISLTEIIKIEYKSYKLLCEKNFTKFDSILLNTILKAFIYIVIISIALVFYNSLNNLIFL